MSEEHTGANKFGDMPALPPIGSSTPPAATPPAATPEDPQPEHESSDREGANPYERNSYGPGSYQQPATGWYGVPPAGQAATQRLDVTEEAGHGQQSGPEPAVQFPAPETSHTGTVAARKPKKPLGTGAVIGIAAATALIVGVGSAVGTWALLPSGGVSGGSTNTVMQADANDTNWTAVASEIENSVVSIQVETSQGTSQGSGVVWDNEGHIVTNNHVVEGAGDGGSNRGYQATVLGTDPATDLAVIKVEDATDALVPITLGDSDALEVGDGVMAIGSPLGLSGSYTTGIVSALNRPVTTGEVSGNSVVTNAIQTSAALNPGNSGGALVDATGQLVGINSSIATLGSTDASGASGSIGIGFAIPVALVQNVASQLIESGTVEHAWLGTANVDGQASFEGSVILGAEVKEITADGPADEAGIEEGDLIVGVNSQDVSSSSSLVGAVRTLTAGDTATLTIIRDGKQTEIDVKLGVSPTLNG
jgi:putative serine protease PepD